MSFEADPVELVGLDSVPPMLEGRLEAVDWDTLGARVRLSASDSASSSTDQVEPSPRGRGRPRLRDIVAGART